MREETLARQKQLGIVPPNTLLTPRQKDIPAWDSLDATRKRLCARMMEIYAAYLQQTDYNVGRVLAAIEQLGQLDNTLVVYIVGDNGASSEGGMAGSVNELAWLNGVPENPEDVLKMADELGTWKTYNHYPVGWASAMCTPFQWEKQIASHFGGTRNGMVISWPVRIKDMGGLRTQFCHTIDVVPTILDVCRLEQPSSVNGVAQKPIEGISYNFVNAVHTRVAAKKELAPGKHRITWEFSYDGGGIGRGGVGTLSVDAQKVADAHFDRTVPGRFSLDEGLDVGEDTGTPVCEDYDVPFKFTGQIEQVVIHLGETKLSAADQNTLATAETQRKASE